MLPVFERPNARGKGRPLGLAQAMLAVGVPLTKQLGWGEKDRPMRTSKPCLDADCCLAVACPNSLCVTGWSLAESAEKRQDDKSSRAPRR